MAADQLIYRVTYHLLAGQHEAAGLVVELGEQSPRELVRFDQRSRRELPWGSVVRMSPGPLKDVLELFSPSGHVRQAALETVPLTPLTARVLVLRCADWVAEVRSAAFTRLRACDRDLLVAALPLVAWVMDEWTRGDLLGALLDERLTDDDLRALADVPDLALRRAAWRRLTARGAITPADVQRAAADEDVAVRGIAARSLPDLAEADRRAAAERLLDDRVGWVAVRALTELVRLDGADRIVPALTARSATVRRAARDWARVRDVDARAVYLARDPRDELALVGLAALRDPRDAELVRAMVDDPRARVRRAGLRALATLDEPEARRIALIWLEAGAGRVAADVLRAGSPSAAEITVLTAIACDRERRPGARERALSLLRVGTWTHFTVAMEASLLTGVLPVPQGRPRAHLRARIARLLPAYDGARRAAIELALR
ncbi:hypothetical protein OJ997_01655 [Solirubrobacter phytolaccae]|uniref:HEAT repeat domain-containing protein n=1 Tax=Solirubrobacter phytolaccae TaxID=1404360 RepID=A0A9X3S6D8_9ACTN|nr:hypothetical protein [Solirubrobacter phytolaccae]MDA0178983.1 hypothetical protein [Solirubrobacter phytolaccae]